MFWKLSLVFVCILVYCGIVYIHSVPWISVYRINLYFKNINRKSFCAHNVNVHYFLLILVYCMMYCICIVQGTILHFIEYKSKDLTSSHNLFCDGILPKRFSMNFQGIDLVLFFLPALRKQPLLYQLLYVVFCKNRLERRILIKKFQACKKGKNCVGVDNTLLYHQNTYDLFLCCKFI